MPCHHCTSARAHAKAAIKAIAKGDIREGATQAKEVAGHVKAKIEAERVRAMTASAK